MAILGNSARQPQQRNSHVRIAGYHRGVNQLTRLNSGSAATSLPTKRSSGSTTVGGHVPRPINTSSLRKENGGQDLSTVLVNRQGSGKTIGWGSAVPAPKPPVAPAPTPAPAPVAADSKHTSDRSSTVNESTTTNKNNPSQSESPSPSDEANSKNVPWALHPPSAPPPRPSDRRWADAESDEEDETIRSSSRYKSRDKVEGLHSRNVDNMEGNQQPSTSVEYRDRHHRGNEYHRERDVSNYESRGYMREDTRHHYQSSERQQWGTSQGSGRWRDYNDRSYPRVGESYDAMGDRGGSMGDRSSSMGDRGGSMGDRSSSMGDRGGSMGDRSSSMGDRGGSMGDRSGSFRDQRDRYSDRYEHRGDYRDYRGGFNRQDDARHNSNRDYSYGQRPQNRGGYNRNDDRRWSEPHEHSYNNRRSFETTRGSLNRDRSHGEPVYRDQRDRARMERDFVNDPYRRDEHERGPPNNDSHGSNSYPSQQLSHHSPSEQRERLHLPPPQSEEDIAVVAVRERDAAEKRAKLQKEAEERARKQRIDDVGKSEDSKISYGIENAEVNETDHSKADKNPDAYNECINNVEMAPTAILRNIKPSAEATDECATRDDTLNQPLLREDDSNKPTNDTTNRLNEMPSLVNNFNDRPSEVREKTYCTEQEASLVKGRVDLNDERNENNENDRRHQYAPLPELSENERREAAIEQQQKILRQVAASRKQVCGTMAVNSDLKENHVNTDRQISNEARPQITTKKLPHQKQTSEEYVMKEMNNSKVLCTENQAMLNVVDVREKRKKEIAASLAAAKLAREEDRKTRGPRTKGVLFRRLPDGTLINADLSLEELARREERQKAKFERARIKKDKIKLKLAKIEKKKADKAAALSARNKSKQSAKSSSGKQGTKSASTTPLKTKFVLAPSPPVSAWEAGPPSGFFAGKSSDGESEQDADEVEEIDEGSSSAAPFLQLGLNNNNEPSHVDGVISQLPPQFQSFGSSWINQPPDGVSENKPNDAKFESMSSIALPMNTGVATWNTFSSPIPGGLQYSSFTGSQPDWGVSHENETTAGKNLNWNNSSSGPISSGINEADDNDHDALANAVVRDVLLSAPESEGSQESPNVKNVVEVAGLTGKYSRKKKRRPTVRKNSRYKPTDPNKKPIRKTRNTASRGTNESGVSRTAENKQPNVENAQPNAANSKKNAHPNKEGRKKTTSTRRKIPFRPRPKKSAEDSSNRPDTRNKRTTRRKTESVQKSNTAADE